MRNNTKIRKSKGMQCAFKVISILYRMTKNYDYEQNEKFLTLSNYASYRDTNKSFLFYEKFLSNTIKTIFQ